MDYRHILAPEGIAGMNIDRAQLHSYYIPITINTVYNFIILRTYSEGHKRLMKSHLINLRNPTPQINNTAG